MRKLMIALLALGLGAAAQAAELKIVVLDPMAAMAGTDQYRKAMGQLDNDLSKDKATLTQLQSDLNTCRQKMQKDAAMMSATEQSRLKSDCEGKARDYQALGQQFQQTVQERQQAVMKDIAPRLEKALDAINKEGGYDLIIQREAAVWARPDMDITAKVSERLNAMSAAPAAGAAPAAAAPAKAPAAPAKK